MAENGKRKQKHTYSEKTGAYMGIQQCMRSCAIHLGVALNAGKKAIANEVRLNLGIEGTADEVILMAGAKIGILIPRKKKSGGFAYIPKDRASRRPLLPRHPDYKRDDAFYTSKAWRELRYLALRNCEGRCQCCGAGPPSVVLHVDHVQPRYSRPDLSLSLDNLQVLCEDCNIGKGAWDSTDWRVKMQ